MRQRKFFCTCTLFCGSGIITFKFELYLYFCVGLWITKIISRSGIGPAWVQPSIHWNYWTVVLHIFALHFRPSQPIEPRPRYPPQKGSMSGKNQERWESNDSEKTINAFQIISNFFFQVEKWSKETPNSSDPMYKTNPKST